MSVSKICFTFKNELLVQLVLSNIFFVLAQCDVIVCLPVSQLVQVNVDVVVVLEVLCDLPVCGTGTFTPSRTPSWGRRPATSPAPFTPVGSDRRIGRAVLVIGATTAGAETR